VPSLSSAPTPLLETPGDVLVVGIRQTPDGPAVLGDAPAEIAAQLAVIGATGARDEVRRLPMALGQAASVATIGLGKDEPDANALREAAGALTRQLRGVDTIVLGLPGASDETAAAILEGAAIGAYRFDDYRSTTDAAQAPASTIVLPGASDEVVARATATAEAVGLVRDLVNTPPNALYPAELAARALAAVEAAAATGAPISAEVLDEDALEAGAYGGILAVGRGSRRGPRLVRIDYQPEGATAHLAYVGKGITFDTGGLSLKPPTGMVGMKYDMTGAATVLAATIAAARLGVATRLTAFLCIAENMPGGDATRPNDVITIKGGTTVEVLNTDAEGRLVLADGLVAASELQPDGIVDVATLTGAARNTFGFRTTVAMGDPDFSAEVAAAAATAGEGLQVLPIGAEWRAELKSDVADLTNVKSGSAIGGMFVAGAFLQDFIGRTGESEDAPQIPWTHLDIAGTANNEGTAWGYTGKGATGATVRTLVQLATDRAVG